MGDLRTGFDATVAISELIEPVDAGVVAAGRKIADQIDFACDNLTGPELTKALYLTPHLMGILKELLATPAARASAGLTKKAGESGGSKLGKLQLAHGKAS